MMTMDWDKDFVVCWEWYAFRPGIMTQVRDVGRIGGHDVPLPIAWDQGGTQRNT